MDNIKTIQILQSQVGEVENLTGFGAKTDSDLTNEEFERRCITPASDFSTV